MQNKAVISEALHLKTEALRISIFEKIQSYEWEIMLKLNQPPQGHHVSPPNGTKVLIAGLLKSKPNGLSSALIRFMSQTKTPNVWLKGEKLYSQKKAIAIEIYPI